MTTRRELIWTLDGNPSTCALAFVGPDQPHPALACDCANGYTGKRSCQDLYEQARADQLFVSARGVVRVVWPVTFVPEVTGPSSETVSLPCSPASSFVAVAPRYSIAAHGPQTVALEARFNPPRGCNASTDEYFPTQWTIRGFRYRAVDGNLVAANMSVFLVNSAFKYAAKFPSSVVQIIGGEPGETG